MNCSRALIFLVLMMAAYGAWAGPAVPLAEKWVSRFNGVATYHDFPGAMATDSRGDVFVLGYLGQASGRYRATLRKLDGVTGVQIWQWESPFSVGLVGDDGLPEIVIRDTMRVAVGPDGDPVVLFYGQGLLKFRGSDGAVEWTVDVPGGLPNVRAYQLALDAQGHVLVAGSEAKAVVQKFHGGTGERLWTHLAPTSGTLRALRADAAGNVFATGYIASPGGSHQAYTVKLSGADGAVLWSAVVPNAGSGARLLALDAAGDVTVALYSSKLVKYRGSDGTQLWQVTTWINPWDLIADAAGDLYLITGSANNYPSVPAGQVSKFDGATGALRWKSFGTTMSSGFRVNLAMRENELLVMGANADLNLSAMDPETGVERWVQRYDGGSVEYTTTGNRAISLMALQPDGGVVIMGASLAPKRDFYEMATIRYAPGPSLSAVGTEWVLPNRVRLMAKVTGYDSAATVYWEYGPTMAYGDRTPAMDVPGSFAPSTVAFTVENVPENTLYHARAVAVGARGTTVSGDFIFTTGWDGNRNGLSDEWELAKWGNTSATRFATGDDDKDGLKNIVEYWLDREPKVFDSAGTPPATIDADGHLSLTLTKRAHVTLHVEASTDLKTWSAATVVREDETTLTAREEFPASMPGGRFLRVRVTP